MTESILGKSTARGHGTTNKPLSNDGLREEKLYWPETHQPTGKSEPWVEKRSRAVEALSVNEVDGRAE